MPDRPDGRPEHAWYECAFGQHYLTAYPRRNAEAAKAEVAFAIEKLGLAPGDRVLDLCCGAGHHLGALQEAKIDAVGVDLSADLLARALQRGPVAAGDMRFLPLAEPFAAVATFFTTIGYFDDEQNQAVLHEINRVLRRGGRFLIDYLNPAQVRSELVPRSERESAGATVHEERWIDEDTAQVRKRVTIDALGGEPIEYTECVRLYGRDELSTMLEAAGLSVEDVYGDFDGSPHTDASKRMILVGAKSAEAPRAPCVCEGNVFRQLRVEADRNFSYLFAEGGECAVVDPVGPEEILALADACGLEIRYVINTHGHYDHTSGNERVVGATGAQVLTHTSSAEPHDVGLEDGARVSLGDGEFEILHTPGHTQDSMCVLWRGRLMSGDTLFVGKVGGTGFGRDARQEYDALHGRLLALPDATEVWPGHDYGVAPCSTVAWERKTNPFLLRPDFDSFVDLKRNWAEYKRTHGIK